MIEPAYAVRPARTDDLDLLADVERSAATVYMEALGAPPGIPDTMPPEALRACHAAGLVWVAADSRDVPVGFLAAQALADMLFVKEMSVHRDHQRQGLGQRLLQAAAGYGASQAYAALALTTDRLIPFNAPFYARQGFAELPPEAAPESLREILRQEAALGFDPARRVLMIRPL